MVKHVLSIAILLVVVFHTAKGIVPPDSTKNYIGPEVYILKFKKLAITEMFCSGIPASVKLAQAIVESEFGNSPLAQATNNHFSIKCRENWSGKSYDYYDDEFDKKGKKVHSCFRSYPSAEASYFDHTDFLMQRKWYKDLFKIPVHDYKAWCKGLKKAGYATIKDYDTKLINLIERFRLYDLDTVTYLPAVEEEIIASKTEAPLSLAKKYGLATIDSLFAFAPATTYDQLFAAAPTNPVELMNSLYFPDRKLKNNEYFNGLRVIRVTRNQTLKEIAEANHIRLRKLIRFNDLQGRKYAPAGSILYLEAKRKPSKEIIHYTHKVRKGETLYAISQFYGIKLQKLRKLNRIKKNMEPLEGEVLALSNPSPDWKVKAISYEDKTKEMMILFDLYKRAAVLPKPEMKKETQKETKSAKTVLMEELSGLNAKQAVNSSPVQEWSRAYTVRVGDTLYKIANTFHVEVGKLKQLNHLDKDELIPGQVLILDNK